MSIVVKSITQTFIFCQAGFSFTTVSVMTVFVVVVVVVVSSVLTASCASRPCMPHEKISDVNIRCFPMFMVLSV